MASSFDGVIRTIEPVLSTEPMTARQVWQRVGMWAPQSVRHALECMADDGQIVRTREAIPTGFRNTYCKPGASA